jgi:hypothetical protein
MMHLIIAAVALAGAIYFVANMIVLVGRIWLAILLVAWCVMAVTTGVLAIALGVQKLTQAVAEWRWRRRYGEILPPE